MQVWFAVTFFHCYILLLPLLVFRVYIDTSFFYFYIKFYIFCFGCCSWWRWGWLWRSWCYNSIVLWCWCVCIVFHCHGEFIAFIFSSALECWRRYVSNNMCFVYRWNVDTKIHFLFYFKFISYLFESLFKVYMYFHLQFMSFFSNILQNVIAPIMATWASHITWNCIDPKRIGYHIFVS